MLSVSISCRGRILTGRHADNRPEQLSPVSEWMCNHLPTSRADVQSPVQIGVQFRVKVLKFPRLNSNSLKLAVVSLSRSFDAEVEEEEAFIHCGLSWSALLSVSLTKRIQGYTSHYVRFT